MSMSRRGFLTNLVGLSVAPAICKAENLMKIVVPKREIILPKRTIVNAAPGFFEHGIQDISRSPILNAMEERDEHVLGRGMTNVLVHMDQYGWLEVPVLGR